MEMVVLVVLLVFFGGAVLLALLNPVLPRWFCDHMDWHLRPLSMGFDGMSMNGVCPRCGREVLLDSQRNWFGKGRQE